MTRKRPDTDIDPARVDVALSKPRPKKRKLPPIPEKLVPLAKEARVRADARPASPGVLLEPWKDEGYEYSSPHRDWEAWELAIADAFGTRSHSTIYTFLDQLTGLCQKGWSDKSQRWKPNETELNCALNMVNSVRPRNEMEAALAAQMVALHFMTMRASEQVLRNGYVIAQDAAIAAKLARTFTMQMDALTRARGKGRTKQSIAVRKDTHVHYHVHEGEAQDFGRPHATDRAGEPAERAALPGPDESGRVVPIASRARKAGVQDTRR